MSEFNPAEEVVMTYIREGAIGEYKDMLITALEYEGSAQAEWAINFIEDLDNE